MRHSTFAARGVRSGSRAILCGALLFSLATVAAPPEQAFGELYRYIDLNGTIHLTNVPTDPRFQRIDRGTPQLRPHLSIRERERLIARHATEQRVHPALLRAVMKAESGFNPAAVSKAGAIGLMQLMPQTAILLNVGDPFDPDQNVRGGATYLRSLLDRFNGKLLWALAAYNAGERAVEEYEGLPPFPETRRFVAKVLRYYRTYMGIEAAAAWRPVKPSTAPHRLQPVLASTSPAR